MNDLKLNTSLNLDGLTGEQPFFYHWIVEREKARIGYETRTPKPWTSDPIIQSYRFCNVKRECDKVTKWIKKNWRDPYDQHDNMVLAMVMARTVNWPDTLSVIGFPDFPDSSFSNWLDSVRESMKLRRERGDKVWTGAYLVSTNGNSIDKIDYILDRVWSPVHYRCRKPLLGESLASYHAELTRFDGLGSFMAAQVIADLKYTHMLGSAPDWDTWAAIGPGSKRGLNRYFGRPLEAPIKTKQFLEEIAMLQFNVQQRLGITLHAQDVQNVACETDKFIRIKNGEGKPRSRYNGY